MNESSKKTRFLSKIVDKIGNMNCLVLNIMLYYIVLHRLEINMSVTSIRIRNDLERELNKYTHDKQRSKNWVINEALRIFFESKHFQEQRMQSILKGLDDIQSGNTIDGDAVDAWLASWGNENETQAPKE